MTLRLSFTFEIEFDGTNTAKAFGVALGWALATDEANARAISEASSPRLERGPITVVDVGERSRV